MGNRYSNLIVHGISKTFVTYFHIYSSRVYLIEVDVPEQQSCQFIVTWTPTLPWSQVKISLFNSNFKKFHLLTVNNENSDCISILISIHRESEIILSY